MIRLFDGATEIICDTLEAFKATITQVKHATDIYIQEKNRWVYDGTWFPK